MLPGKKILVGVCGSIAAYKSALLIRLLKKNGAEVKVIMTPSASSFITPLTLATLSDHPVFTEFISGDTGLWTNHVELGLWADHFIIAPASAHTIGKLANGICDNLLAAVYLSARCKVSIAPAMDLDMFAHPSVQKNLDTLRTFGNFIIDPDTGELASGLFGKGRMAEPEALLDHIKIQFLQNQLKDKKVLITAGPTYEPIDPVRFIGNRSSGKMGYQLAKKAIEMDASVTLITGPSSVPLPHGLIAVQKVETAIEMYNAVEKCFDQSDIVIFAAAVADYAPKYIQAEKIKKSDTELNLDLIKTVDIAAEMGKLKREDQFIIGFALETEHQEENARRKMIAKNLDMVVLNSTKDHGATFGFDTNKISIIKRDGSMLNFDLKDKSLVAADILNTLLDMIDGK